MSKTRLCWLLLLVSCVVTLPLLGGLRYRDDFMFHTTAWLELSHSWSSGVLAPGWDAHADFLAGEPRFLFYPPISFWVGSALSLLLPFYLVPPIYMTLCMALAAASMYAASKSFLPPEQSATAALLYACNPYLLLTGLWRFAAAELLVQAWLPLLLASFVCVLQSRDRRSVLHLAFLLGLSLLTNVPTAILLMYALSAVVLVEAVVRRSLRFVWCWAAALVLALVLSCFYWLPARVESQWIMRQALLDLSYRKYFLVFMTASDRPKLMLLSSIVCLFEVAGIVCAIRWSCVRNAASRTLVLLALVAFFFCLPISAWFWHSLPQLAYVQFPFRFLSLLAAVFSLIVLMEIKSQWIRRGAYAVSILLGVILLVSFWRGASRNTAGLDELVRAWSAGYPARPEYTFVGGVQRSGSLGIDPVSLEDSAQEKQCQARLLNATATGEEIGVRAAQPCVLRLRRNFFPYWQAHDEGNRVLTTGQGSDGLLLVTVPAGEHTVQVHFSADSRVRTSARVVSLLGWLGLLLLLLLDWRRKRVRTSSA